MTFFAQFTEGVIGNPSNAFYRKKKKSGGYRIIGRPKNKAMIEVQKRLLNFFRKIAPRFHSAAAGKGGLGSVKNARVHKGRDFKIKIDFVNAFGHTSGRKISELIATRTKMFLPKEEPAPSADEWYAFLSQYVLMRSGGLIQGAKTSPLLLDWYCEVYVDRPIRKILYMETFKEGFLYPGDGNGIIYTRYVDDLFFSGNYRLTRALRARIREVIAKAGYLESHWKTKVVQLSKHGTVRITGPRVGEKGHFGLPRKKVKEMERMLDRALREPLFDKTEPSEIEGKLLYLMDVTRGKEKLNALEARTLDMYREWCEKNGRNAGWPTKILARKWKKKHSPERRKRRVKPKQ